MRRCRGGALAPVVAALLASSVAPFSAAQADDVVMAEEATLVVEDAVLTWGLNDESNNKAFAPGTFNFLSAGAVPDPGQGGQSIVEPGMWRGTATRAWRAQRGATRVEKRAADGTWAPATFSGLGTSADGTALTSTSGPFSGHRVVLSGGKGSIDPAAGTMDIAWPGTFSVVYYSGFTFFTVTDVTLEVADDEAQVLATLSGFAADRDDPDTWGPVVPERVVLADLPPDEIQPADAGAGFTAQPAYRGVRYGTANGDQVRSGPDWGAFPASFLAYMDRVGSAAFWYSSGGSADPNKVPHPITVSYDASAPVPEPETPTTTPSATPSTQPTTPVNPAPPTPTPEASAPTIPSPTVGVGVGATRPPVSEAPASSTAPSPQTLTVLATSATSTTPRASSVGPLSAPTWTWWCGTTLLLGAAVLTLLTIRSKGSS